MNARGFRSLTVTLLMLGASIAIMAASVSRVQITANRDLVIAIVDSRRTTPASQEFRAELAQTLREVIGQTFGADLHVRSVVVGARDAKLKLNGGDFDAALVIGDDRPFALRRLDLVTLAGDVPQANGRQSVYFIMANGDPALNQQLRSAFARLITDRASGKSAPHFTGATVKLATING